MIKRLNKRWLKECLMGFFLAALLGFIYVGVKKVPYYHDLTRHQHALSATTQSLLAQFTKPIEITLYTENRDLYQPIQLLVERYQRLQPHIQFQWIPQAFVQNEKMSRQVLRLKYGDNEHVINIDDKILNENLLTSSLFTLQRKANQWLVFLQGHDEPSPFGHSNRDFGLLRLGLQNQGLKVQALQLSTTPVLAQNTQLLIIASPKTAFLSQEQALIDQYLSNGGDLLWMIDPSSDKSSFLSQQLGVTCLPGTVIDLHGQKLGTPHPAITIIEHLPTLPFSSPQTLIAMPFACALKQTPTGNWQSRALLITDEFSWTEQTISSNQMAFEPEKGDVAGPLLVGLSLSRTHPHIKDREQRIAIIGNSRFLSNGAIENYGNLAFGLNLFNWLAHDDALLTITQPTSVDTLLSIHLPIALLIQYGFPFSAVMLTLVAFIYHYRRIRKSNRMAALLSRHT